MNTSPDRKSAAPAPEYISAFAASDKRSQQIYGSPLLRLLAAWLLLLPLLLVMGMAFVRALCEPAAVMDGHRAAMQESLWCALLGVALFGGLVYVKLPRNVFNYIYTFGHEATHAVAVWLCLGKVMEFHVTSTQGGYIRSNKSNLFISLAPYFVPFWMLVWMLLLTFFNAAFSLGHYGFWYYVGAGFWWAFHMYWTFWVIPREQSDLLKHGYFFSVLVVLVTNVFVLAVIFSGFGLISFGYFLQEIQAGVGRLLDALGSVLGVFCIGM